MPNQKFTFIPYKTKLKMNARENRVNMTSAEKKIWYEILANKQFFGYRFARQKTINNFIVDFYCAKLLLVIEIDGDTHGDQREYDKWRTERLQFYSIKVIRFDNNDVLCNLEGVYQDLLSQIRDREQLLGLKTP
ncbi:MAG: endonuclease domain-containing protein [Parcubacteria group bacterium]|nr:endonuclease domain-containing protein [Parcubacteria group bacterium]